MRCCWRSFVRLTLSTRRPCARTTACCCRDTGALPLPLWERVGVRGSVLSIVRNPSPELLRNSTSPTRGEVAPSISHAPRNFRQPEQIPDTRPHSRDVNRPGCAFIFRPREGAGKAGCSVHPQPRVRNKKHTSVVTTGSPDSPGLPCAMVLRFPSCSPRRAALFCHRRQRSSRQLDTSVRVSGPHDFSVREWRSRQQPHPRPPHPAPYVRDDRETPLFVGRGRQEL
jgi:hypothetical protein